MGSITPYFPSILSAAICTAMVRFAFTRRRDGTRRMIFAVGAIVVVPAIILVVAAHQPDRDFDIVGWVFAVPIWIAIVATAWVGGMGWFGFAKRVGDHPYCRKCGFDLFGKPAESTRCSECGAELGEKKAVVIGVRMRRYPVLAVCLFFFLLGPLIGGRPIYKWVEKTDWQAFKPMWWLISDLKGSNAITAEQAIVNRFSNREMSSSEVKALVKYLLAQPSTSPRLNLMYYAVQWMADHDEIDESECRRLIQFAAKSRWAVVPPKLVRGSPIPMRMYTIDQYFFGANFAGTSEKVTSRLGGIELPLPTGSHEYDKQRVDPGSLWSKIPDGQSMFVLELDAVVHFRAKGKNYTEVLTSRINCPTNIATGSAAHVPSTRPTDADLAAKWTATFGYPRGLQDETIGLSIDCSGGSTRVVAHVILIDSAGRQDIGMAEGTPRNASFVGGKGFRRPVGKARIELVPAPETTLNDWNQTPFLDQTIVIDQVTVESDRASD